MSAPKNGFLVSRSDNVEGIVKFKKGTAEMTDPGGICLGMTIMWLKNVVLNGDFTYTHSTAAALTFGMYHVHGKSQQTTMAGGVATHTKRDANKGFWESRKMAFKMHNLDLKNVRGEYLFDYPEECFNWAKQQGEGAYSIKTDAHALAMHIGADHVHYFDPNYGVYRYPMTKYYEPRIHVQFEYCWTPEGPDYMHILPVVED